MPARAGGRPGGEENTPCPHHSARQGMTYGVMQDPNVESPCAGQRGALRQGSRPKPGQQTRQVCRSSTWAEMHRTVRLVAAFPLMRRRRMIYARIRPSVRAASGRRVDTILHSTHQPTVSSRSVARLAIIGVSAYCRSADPIRGDSRGDQARLGFRRVVQ